MDFYWKAIYDDGTELKQYKVDGSKNKYPDINRDRLAKFVLCQVNSDEPTVVVHITEGMRLVCRQRVALTFGSTDLAVKNTVRVWLVGWQKLVEGRNVQTVMAVFPDGHIEVTDGFKENIDWFRPVKFRPEERV